VTLSDHGARILVVEDEAIVARDIRQQLAQLGYTPLGPATRGEQAIALAHELRPDLVLMDIRLVGSMNGVTAALSIRRELSLPIVFLTAFSEEETLAEAKNAEPFGYIIKPFSDRELRSVLEMALYKASAEAKLRERAEALALANSQLASQTFAIDQHAIVCVTDVDGRITYVNDNYCSTGGYTREEVIGRHHREFASGLHPAALFAELWETITRGGGWHGELCNRAKDGSRYWVQSTIVPLAGPDGVVSSYMAIQSDITEKRRAEAERGRLEAELNQSQKMEYLGRLSGGVAHDFNNLLAVVLANSEHGLAFGQPSPLLRECLTEINTAALRAADLTRKLLVHARKQPLSLRELDANEATEAMLGILRRLLGEDLEVVWQPAPEVWRVHVDPSQLDQIVANLCINARDAIAGVGKIVVSTSNEIIDEEFCAARPEGTPGEYVRLEVSDTGCGMDAETVARIFEPFFTTKQRGEGTGLGLATVYGAVKQSGGFVSVTSQPGAGATFSVYLPRHRSSAAASERGRGIFRPAHGGSETILVVEDERAILDITARVLRAHGYLVLGARGPVEALELARDFRGGVHLLLTDVILPRMNGRSLATELASIFPSIKVVFMSGYPPDVVALRGVVDGPVHYLQKPFTAAGLIAAVRSALDGSSALPAPSF
jgi:two-component system, cell cycle sensor histidine kinase and response regulator CckA